MGATPGDLSMRLYDLTKSLRRIKQQQTAERPTVSPGMIAMLKQIDGLPGGCHGRELAARSGLDPSTVSRGVAWLVTRGLVERRVDPADKRASVLALTPAGRATLVDTECWYGRVLERALAGWTPDEIAALCAAMDRFTHDIEATLGPHDSLEVAR